MSVYKLHINDVVYLGYYCPRRIINLGQKMKPDRIWFTNNAESLGADSFELNVSDIEGMLEFVKHEREKER